MVYKTNTNTVKYLHKYGTSLSTLSMQKTLTAVFVSSNYPLKNNNNLLRLRKMQTLYDFFSLQLCSFVFSAVTIHRHQKYDGNMVSTEILLV